MSDQPVLAQSLVIGTMRVNGRVFKAATSETRATVDGFVTDELIEFYEPMARAATPLIITGNLCVSKQGHSAGKQASIDRDDKIPGLRRWADEIQRHGTKLIAQLNHGGRQVVRPEAGDNPVVSASDVLDPSLGTKPRALRHDEIPGVVESFAAAAVRAREAGFAGVQLHFAHGYLVSQFLAPHTNRRTDEYGGHLSNRMRLPLEILRAVRRRMGDDYPILAKINGTDALTFRRGATPDELLRFGKALQDEGIDAIEISRAHYESVPPMLSGSYRGFLSTNIKQGSGKGFSPARKRVALALAPVLEPVLSLCAPKGEGYNLPHARRFKETLKIPVITNGGFVSRHEMENAIAGGLTDAVSCARAFIANPYLYQHLLQPIPNAPTCQYCNKCIARLGGLGVHCYEPETLRRRAEMLGVA